MARPTLGVDDVAQLAAISRAAIFGWLNPSTQPSRKGIRLKNAWAVARAYAAAAGIDNAVAFTALFVDAPVEQPLAQRRRVSGT